MNSHCSLPCSSEGGCTVRAGGGRDEGQEQGQSAWRSFPLCLEIACCGSGQAGPKQLLSTSECSVLDVQRSVAQGSSSTGRVSRPLAFSSLLMKCSW